MPIVRARARDRDVGQRPAGARAEAKENAAIIAREDTGALGLLEAVASISGRPLVIVNPRSGGGLSEARWARIRGALADGLGELDSAFTTAPRDATEIAAARSGRRPQLILALGGDGTISEVADGVLAAGAGATAEIGLIPRGTGGDFRRTLELPEEIARRGAAHPRAPRAAGRRGARPLPRGRRRRGGPALHQRRVVRVLQRGGAPGERVEQELGGKMAFFERDAARAARRTTTTTSGSRSTARSAGSCA